MRTLSNNLCLLIALCMPLVAAAQVSDTATLGQQCADDFLQGRLDALWNRMTQEMQQAFGSSAALHDFWQKSQDALGAETQLEREDVEVQQQFRVYARQSIYAKNAARAQLRCTFDNEDSIAGFQLQPVQNANMAAPTAYMDYQTQTPLRLPFDGEWFTVWGGRTIENNYHVIARDQRFAYDFVVVQDGKTHEGDPAVKENYYCWNRKVLAPAAGTVVLTQEDLPDHAPGITDRANPAGNHVMLDLGNSEFALLGHLQQDSVIVQQGQSVRAGQELGRCGNSGNTSEPHLHFHLQNTGIPGDGDGLPAYFNDYLANGAAVRRGEPLRGQGVAAESSSR